MKAKVVVTLKNGVLDPQGKAIEGALSSLGFEGVNQVRQGKLFEIDLATSSAEEARRDLTAMCDRLLANTVIESYRIELV
ncbi:MAG: phosphoribosylformylglycinamidine synthase subunit PurS [Bauldia sp.]